MATFGGITLERKDTAIEDPVLRSYGNMRSERVERLLKDTCEVCGVKEKVHMHHVRHLADLNKKGQREKPLWRKLMISRKRKSIPRCKRCHDDIHFNRPKFRKYRRLESRMMRQVSSPVRGGAGGKGHKGPRP